MIIHSPVGWKGTDPPPGRKKHRQLTASDRRANIAERQLRRLQHRIAHLAALMRLNAIRGSGKFPSDGNLRHGGKRHEGRTGSW